MFRIKTCAVDGLNVYQQLLTLSNQYTGQLYQLYLVLRVPDTSYVHWL